MIIKNMFKKIEEYDKIFTGFLNGCEYEEVYANTIVEEELLRKCNYFESFPNYIITAFPIKSENFHGVTIKNKVELLDVNNNSKFLLPAACLEVYPYYAQTRKGENIIYTFRTKVYRNEEYYDEIRRSEFTVREIVCIGTPEFVEEKMQYLQKVVMDFAEKKYRKVSIKESYDMFYNSPKNKVKGILQKKNGLKLELTIPYKDGGELALASFNYHKNHFSDIFGFSQAGIQTACLGFGIERFIESEEETND